MRVTVTLELDEKVPAEEQWFHVRNALCHLIVISRPELPAFCSARRQGLDTQIAVEEDKPCQ